MINNLLEKKIYAEHSILIKENNKNKYSFSKNDIFSAKIKDKNNKNATLVTEFQNEFKVKSQNITGDMGDKVFFQVVENTKNRVILKQIFPVNQKNEYYESNLKKNEHIKELFIKNNFIDESKKEDKAEQIKKTKAVMQIKRKLSYGLNNIDTSLVKELVANGINIANIDFSLLFEMVIEINKTSPADNVKLNERNVEIITNAFNKLVKSINLSKSEIKSVLENSGDITLNDIYFAKHAGNEKPEPTVYINFINIDTEISKYFENENIENNDQNKKIANFLLENQMPINKKNIDKTGFLLNISDKIDINKFLDKVVNCIKSFENPDEIVLFKMSEKDGKQRNRLVENYKKVIENLPSISSEKIDFLLKNQIPLSLFNLRNVRNENMGILYETQKISNNVVMRDYLFPKGEKSGLQGERTLLNGLHIPVSQDDFDIQIITAKKQIAEIQLKLTYEAAIRLADKSIYIDMMPLEQAINSLKALENENYEKNIKIMGETPSAENLNSMGNLYNKLNSIFPLTFNVFRDIILEKSSFTLSNVDQLVNQARLAEHYENFMSVPSKKNGETFAKIRGEISPFLEKTGIIPTDKNMISFEILSKNKLDITAENIEKVKLINNKIEYVANKLYPNIAATIFSQGINPLDMHIDELISYIDGFNHVFGENLKCKIEKYLLQLDNLKSIDDPTRDAMLSVYRTLNQIQRENSVSLGVALKNNISPTLGNLFEASKYFQKTRGQKSNMDYEIHQNFGMLTELKNIEKTIKANIDRGAVSLTNTDFAIKNFIDQAPPQNLEKIMREQPLYMHTPIEDIHTEPSLQRFSSIDNFKTEENYNLLQEIFSTPAMAIHWLEVSKISTTPQNLKNMKNFLKDQFYLGKIIDKANKKYGLNLDDNILDENLSLLTEKAPSEILDDISCKLEDAKETVSNRNSLHDFLVIQNGIKLQNKLQNRNGNAEYRLPIKIGDKIANLNMYIINQNSSDKSKALLSLNMENIGDVQFFVEMDKNLINMNICCDNQQNLIFLESNKDKLVKYINDTGYVVNYMDFTLKEPKNKLNDDISIK